MTDPPVIDWSVIESFRELESEDEPGVATEILATFRAESAVRMARLRDAVERRDLPEIQRSAHSMRGSAGVVGAIRLSAAAERLEVGAASGEAWAVVHADWTAVAEAFALTMTELDRDPS